MFKGSIFAIFLIGIIGCSAEKPSAPDCRVITDDAEESHGNAGCAILYGDKLVTITHRKTNKLDLPGGTGSNSEYAQCTAHRETWEETGINVAVSSLLHQFDNGYKLYKCETTEDFPYTNSQELISALRNIEVSSVQLTDIYATEPDDWRYPENLQVLKNAISAN